MSQIKRFIEFCKELDIEAKSEFAVEVYLRHQKLNTIEGDRCKYCGDTCDDKFCSDACENAYKKEAYEEKRGEEMFEQERGN